MSESIGESQETGSTADTGQTYQTSDTSGTSIPLARLPTHKTHRNENDIILPQLPSYKFSYSVWHDLRNAVLKGDELHAPRVRKGPREEDKLFYTKQEEGTPIHHSLTGQQRTDHMIQHENWQNAKVLNLSFQELHQKYQRDNFNRILQNSQNVVTLNLVNNNITTMKSHQFPHCQSLNLNNNYIGSFMDFPETPSVRFITATYNSIQTLYGIQRYAYTPLEELNLTGNPVTFLVNYRQAVFSLLPKLRVLDKVVRLQSDSVFHGVDDLERPDSSRGCIIL